MCRIEMNLIISGKIKLIFILINFKTHIVSVLLVCLNGLLQQFQSLCLLLTVFILQSDSLHNLNCTFTVKC